MSFCQARECEQVATWQVTDWKEAVVMCGDCAQHAASLNELLPLARQVTVEPLGGGT